MLEWCFLFCYPCMSVSVSPYIDCESADPDCVLLTKKLQTLNHSAIGRPDL